MKSLWYIYVDRQITLLVPSPPHTGKLKPGFYVAAYILFSSQIIRCSLSTSTMWSRSWTHPSQCVRDLGSSAGRRLSGSCLLLHQLFFPGILEIHHAVFESLDLVPAFSPILVFSHALLDSIMLLGAAGAGYHPFNWVVLIIFPAAVMGWRGRHPVSVHRADSLLRKTQDVVYDDW